MVKRTTSSSSAHAAAQAAATALDVVVETTSQTMFDSTIYDASNGPPSRIALSTLDMALNTPPPSHQRRTIVDPNNTLPDDNSLTRSQTFDDTIDEHVSNKENQYILISPLQHAKHRRSTSLAVSVGHQPPPKFAMPSAMTATSTNTTTTTTTTGLNIEWQQQSPAKKSASVPTCSDYEFKVSDLPEIKDDGSKPQFSYAMLIGMAILLSPQRRLTLAQIYKWINDTFSWYKTNHSGWQNSIRHNLSLNKSFSKQNRPKTEPGKGNYWIVVPGHEKYFLNTRKRGQPVGLPAARSHSSVESRRSRPPLSDSSNRDFAPKSASNQCHKPAPTKSTVSPSLPRCTERSASDISIAMSRQPYIPAKHLHTIDLKAPSSPNRWTQHVQPNPSLKRKRSNESSPNATVSLDSPPRKKFDINNTEFPSLTRHETPVRRMTAPVLMSPMRRTVTDPVYTMSTLAPSPSSTGKGVATFVGHAPGLQLQHQPHFNTTSSPVKTFTPSRFLDDTVLHSLTALDDEDLCAFGSPSRPGPMATSTALRKPLDSALNVWPFDESTFSSSPQRP